MNKAVILTFAYLLAVLLLPMKAMADITLGVFPHHSETITQQMFKPLVKKLQEELGEPVKLVIPKNFKTFWAGVVNKQFDFVHFNQYHYIKSHKEHGYKAILANEEFGSKTVSGTLAVRKDSGINTIADLKGKTILFGGHNTAMVSYIAPVAMLKKAGLVVKQDYTAQFAKDASSAIIGVYNKVASASGSSNITLKNQSVTKKINKNNMKILAKSEPFVHLTWAVSPNVPQKKYEKIQSIMSDLHTSKEGRTILTTAQVTGFYTVKDSDFDTVRDITKFSLSEDY